MGSLSLGSSLDILKVAFQRDEASWISAKSILSKAPAFVSLLVDYLDFVRIEPGVLGKLWRDCLLNPSNPDVWECFLAHFFPLLVHIARNTAMRWGIQTKEEIDDVVQDICLKLSQQARMKLHPVESNESTEAYLRVVATNAARDSLRARFAGKRGKSVTAPLEDRVVELAGALDSPVADRQLLLRQIDDHLQASNRDRNVFWLYYRSGFTAKEIAAIPSLSLTQKGVESLLFRMTQLLREKLGPQ